MVLQDWLTIMTGGAYTVVQSQSSYLDLGDIDDIVLYLEVRQASTPANAAPSMSYQTSPSTDDASFVTIVPQFNLVSASTPRVDRILSAFAGVPLARYLRWVVSGLSCQVTFRICVAPYAPGA